MASIITACDIYQTDTGNLKKNDTITLTGGSIVDVSSLTAGSIQDALVSAGITKCGLKSKEWTDPSGGSIVLKITDVANGVPTYEVTGQKSGLDILKGDTE
jgi:hypothetical protein